MTSGLVKHTTVFDDCFTVEDKCQTRPVSDLSQAHSLLAPRKKLNSQLCSGVLKSRREKQQRPGRIPKVVGEKLKKNFYKAKVYYRRRYQVEKKKVFKAKLREKAYVEKLNQCNALDQERCKALQIVKKELSRNEELTSKLSVSINELKEEKSRSITTYVHHKLMRE